MKELRMMSIALLLALTGTSKAQTTIELENGAKGYSDYLKLGATKIYYEVYGEGTPLLILHGNGGSSRGRHHMVPEFAKNYQVILMDSRCHGNSSCSEDLNYQLMAEDANALMEHLNHEKYMIWGHSDGGIVGLILGYKYPHRINRMLVSGANLRPDTTALENELVAFTNQYDRIQDPHLSKQIELMAKYPNIDVEKMAEVNVPVMLMVGDRDAIKMSHTLEIFEALPKANLCVLPGTTHFISSERPDQIYFWMNELTRTFSMPSTIDIANQMAKSIFK